MAFKKRSRSSMIWGTIARGLVGPDLAEQIFGDLDGCKIMILGAGETSEKTAKAFRSRGAEQIFVSNRSLNRFVYAGMFITAEVTFRNGGSHSATFCCQEWQLIVTATRTGALGLLHHGSSRPSVAA
jgi:glutamyl-tRNA reductase